MHEASIALSLVEMLVDIARENKAKRVLKARVKVGELSGVVVDSLVFAFLAVREDWEETKHTELEVEEVPVMYRCLSCSREFRSEAPFFVECPFCLSSSVELISGEELDLVDVELET